VLSEEQVELLIDDLHDLHGIDFHAYTRASLKRRLDRVLTVYKLPSFAELRYKIQTDPVFAGTVVEEITVNVTEMFRDPLFFKYLRLNVLPLLAAKPHIRIWHAGCSTGEEVFSMAITLHELGLLKKSILYATDLNMRVLENVKNGFVPLSAMRQYSQNYIESGGSAAFSEYYTAGYDNARIRADLRQNIVVASHNLATDGSFNEFDLIVCRNVLIYFDRPLQNRAFRLFNESLSPLGYLALGSKETLKFSDVRKSFQQCGNEKIWKKIS
jgi:chemotaxis protein methyltransferase CheR